MCALRCEFEDKCSTNNFKIREEREETLYTCSVIRGGAVYNVCIKHRSAVLQLLRNVQLILCSVNLPSEKMSVERNILRKFSCEMSDSVPKVHHRS